MVVTDPIADMLTRIRNALIAKHDEVDIPASKTKRRLPISFWRKAISPALKIRTKAQSKAT